MRSLRNSARVCTSEICLLPISRLRSLPCSESLSIPTRRAHNAPDPCQQRTFNTGLRHLPNRREQSGSHDATIYAVSTAPGRAAIAIIRISGPACINVGKRIRPDSHKVISNRSTMESAQESQSLGPDMPVSELYIIQSVQPLKLKFLILMFSSFFSRVQSPRQGKISLSFTFMADQQW